LTSWQGKIFYTSPFKYNETEGKDGVEVEVTIQDEGKDRSFIVQAKHKLTLSTKMIDDFYTACKRREGTQEEPHQLITAFEICLKHHLINHMGLVDAGRRFFPRPNGGSVRALDLGGGMELWTGFVQSLRVCQSGLYLNIDKCSSAFWKTQPFLETCSEIINYDLERLDRRQTLMLRKELKGLKIDQIHTKNHRRWKVQDISEKNAHQERFTDREGNEHTVASYFEQKYRKLRFPNYPLVLIKTNPKLYLPMECCVVAPNQRLVKVLNDQQMGKAIKVASLQPKEHQRKTQEVMDNVRYEPAGIHGLVVEKRMQKVNGRLIDAPQLAYLTTKRGYSGDTKSAETSMSPLDGSWNMRDKQVIKGGELVCWGVLSLIDPAQRKCDFRMDDIQNFIQQLVRNIGKTMGIHVQMERPPILVKGPRDSIADAYEKTCNAAYSECSKMNGPDKARGPQLVIVIKETRNKDEYREVKKASDSNCGVPSQCVLVEHLWGGGNPMYLANVGLKINQKIGGQNTAIAGAMPHIDGVPLNNEPIMVLGADVTHFPREGGKPSIAAMVGTVDNKLVKFVSTLRFQHHVTETLECVGEMVVDLVEQFRSQNGILPTRLVMYRDGVASSQFPAILGTEYQQIKDACAEMKDNNGEKGYCPKVTYVVLQKSHNIRFFASERNDEDRSGNVKAGTVIDSDITHPYEHDFFLMSQAGLKGTSKPSRYIVLKDENGFSADAIQHFTYWQCYTFGRATKAVSCVPSIYYAHLLAFRARHMMYEDFDDNASVSTSTSTGMKPFPGYAYTNFHAQIVDKMFYV
jgi:eukaryotic translation initiation factor 2C